ncbi:MAG: hypothetical protein PWQ68_2227, partial [Thermoanaerobacteraceae bacterium]|nr:hypothetical protein [Thermoanaerobacteraceae bacterium]
DQFMEIKSPKDYSKASNPRRVTVGK